MGWVQFLWSDASGWRTDPRPSWSFSFNRLNLDVDERDLLNKLKPFSLIVGTWDNPSISATVPYWFLTTVAAMATALSFKRTWRLTTRQLLIATTALALLLGAVAWSIR
jgi:hypothetical protein